MIDRPEEHKVGGRGALFGTGIFATVVLHGAIAALIWIGRASASSSHPLLDGQVVDVQAVRFGKPRDLSFLPHKQAVVVDKGPKPKLALTENEHALPHLPDPNKPPTQDDPLKRTHAELFKQATDEPQAGSEGEGDPRGLRGGTSQTGRGPVYYQHLQAAVQNAWTVPTTISDDVLATLKATACIKIDESGKIVDVTIAEASKSDTFNASLRDALNSIKQFEPPTPDVKDAVTSDGVCMKFAKTR